jgi:hypothetical protein
LPAAPSLIAMHVSRKTKTLACLFVSFLPDSAVTIPRSRCILLKLNLLDPKTKSTKYRRRDPVLCWHLDVMTLVERSRLLNKD